MMLTSNRKHRNKNDKISHENLDSVFVNKKKNSNRNVNCCKRFRAIFVLLLFLLILCVINSYFYIKSRADSRGNGRNSNLDSAAIKAGAYSSFNPKDNKNEDDILPISNDGNNLRHQEDIMKVEHQLDWAQDGTVVKRLGEKGLIGELIGEPFICPSYYYSQNTKTERGKIYCVQIFFESNSRFLTEPLRNYELVHETKMKHLRSKLAKFWKLSKRLDSFIIRLLFDTYKTRPLYLDLSENSFSTIVKNGKKTNQLIATAKTGMDIHVEICSVVKWLNRVYLIPRDGSTDTLMVNYGTQKHQIFFNLYLMSVVGNFNMLMLNNYIYFKETIEKIVYEKKQNVKNLILFIPSYISSEACLMINNMLLKAQDGNGMIEQVVVISITKNVEIDCSSSLSKTTQDKVKYNTYSKLVKEYKQWECSTTPLITSNYPVEGRHYIARSNPQNEAEIVEYTYKFTQKYYRTRIYNNLHKYPLLPISPMVSMHSFPMSSGDTTAIFEALAYGRMHINTPLNFARYEIFSNLIQPDVFGGSPVQLPHVHEEFNLKRGFGINHPNVQMPGPSDIDNSYSKYKIWNSKRLEMCFTGGGFPNPYTMAFLTNTGHCPNGVKEGWGSYENWDIGWGERNTYSFIETNVLDWEVADYGPYKKVEGKGELLLRTKAMNQHDEERYNSERYFMLDGQKFFHTRDIIEVVAGSVGEVDGAKISMIDKTTCPFQLKNGKWIRTGMVERAIEGQQTVFLNSVIFGSKSSNDIVAVVWLSNAANIKYRNDDANNSRLLEYLQNVLKDQVHNYEIPKYILKSDEPWEYRPRAKIRKVLQLKFGNLVNKIIPDTVDLKYAGGVNLAVEKNNIFVKRIQNELKIILRQQNDASATDGCDDSKQINICNILLGCFVDQDGDGSCLIRTKSGLLREPSMRRIPYNPEKMSLTDRLNRFDNEPWHFWDLQENNVANSHFDLNMFTKSLLVLKNNKQRLDEVLPLILPSLGLLIPYGLRFRMRLDCLIKIASMKPDLFSQRKMTKQLHIDVIKICRHEWFEDFTDYSE